MKILFVTMSFPEKRANGADTATDNYVSAMRKAGADVDVVAYSRDGASPNNPHLISAGHWNIEIETAGKTEIAGWLLRSFVSGRPFINSKFVSRQMIETLRRCVARKAYNLLAINQTHMAWVADLDFLPKKTLFIPHNLESKLYGDMAGFTGAGNLVKRSLYARDSRLLTGVEGRLARGAAQVWTLSESDRAGFARLAPEADIRNFDLPGRALPPVTGAPVKSRDVGILGAWLWEVNRNGLRWLVDAVMPDIPADITVHVAGKGAETVPHAFGNLRYEGFVEDAASFLRSCRVLLIPTVSGGGVQLKTIEGISSGVPIVATHLGLRGMTNIPDHVVAADDPQGFAAAIVHLVRADAPSRYEVGQKWANDRRATFEQRVADAIDALGSGLPRTVSTDAA